MLCLAYKWENCRSGWQRSRCNADGRLARIAWLQVKDMSGKSSRTTRNMLQKTGCLRPCPPVHWMVHCMVFPASIAFLSGVSMEHEQMASNDDLTVHQSFGCSQCPCSSKIGAPRWECMAARTGSSKLTACVPRRRQRPAAARESYRQPRGVCILPHRCRVRLPRNKLLVETKRC